MGVYIPNMKMPKDCKSCRFSGFGGILNEFTVCSFTGSNKELMNDGERFNDCPLVEIKTPHGRLIDEDDIISLPDDDDYYDDLIRPLISTVIEAEEADDKEV